MLRIFLLGTNTIDSDCFVFGSVITKLFKSFLSSRNLKKTKSVNTAFEHDSFFSNASQFFGKRLEERKLCFCKPFLRLLFTPLSLRTSEWLLHSIFFSNSICAPQSMKKEMEKHQVALSYSYIGKIVFYCL
jgi:hypothetical protein